jgi:hypothetical protein
LTEKLLEVCQQLFHIERIVGVEVPRGLLDDKILGCISNGMTL